MKPFEPRQQVKEAMPKPSIRHWPVAERPRERLLERGASQLADAEVVALILRSGQGGLSAVDLARNVLARVAEAGGWDHLGAGGLQRLKGLGPAKAAALMAALELGRRTAREAPVAERLLTSRQAWAHCRADLEEQMQERLLVLVLDAKHRLLVRRVVSLGTLTQSLVHPREIFKPALELGAAAVVVAHNHPSGDPCPSPEDHQTTQRLKQAASLLGVTLVDHLVVGKGRYFSYADHGWIVDGIRLGDDRWN